MQESLTTTLPPQTIDMHAPGDGWVPLAPAIFDWQAIEVGSDVVDCSDLADVLWPLSEMPDVLHCRIDQDAARLVVRLRCDAAKASWHTVQFLLGEGSVDETALAAISPLSLAKALSAEVAAISSLIAWRFRTAVRLRQCEVYARDGSATAPAFTRIEPDVLDTFCLTKWSPGMAEATPGPHQLFSIHVKSASLSEPNKFDEYTPAQQLAIRKSNRIYSTVQGRTVMRFFKEMYRTISHVKGDNLNKIYYAFAEWADKNVKSLEKSNGYFVKQVSEPTIKRVREKLLELKRQTGSDQLP